MRLPPLPTLHAFVAVAKVQSITRAATQLHLTHGAVSHQMRQLQQTLGIALFERVGRGVRLTPAGVAYAARLERVFAEIADATAQAVASQSTRRLRISVMPSFASRWLLHRVGEFIARQPDADVQVQSTAQLADIAGGDADVAVRFGPGRYPGLTVRLLMHDWYYPVCSPAFMQQHDLRTPAALADVPLLRSADESWRPWFHVAGLNLPEPSRGVMFDDSSLMLMAAATGKGVALARHSLVADAVAGGQLLRPFAPVLPSPNSYWLITRPNDAGTPLQAAFCNWLFAEAASCPPPAGAAAP